MQCELGQVADRRRATVEVDLATSDHKSLGDSRPRESRSPAQIAPLQRGEVARRIDADHPRISLILQRGDSAGMEVNAGDRRDRQAAERGDRPIEPGDAGTVQRQPFDIGYGSRDGRSRSLKGDVAPSQQRGVAGGVELNCPRVALIKRGGDDSRVEVNASGRREVQPPQRGDRTDRSLKTHDPRPADGQLFITRQPTVDGRAAPLEADVATSERGEIGARVKPDSTRVPLIARGADLAAIEVDRRGRRDREVVEASGVANRTIKPGDATARDGQALDPNESAANGGARASKGDVAASERGRVAGGIEHHGPAVALVLSRFDQAAIEGQPGGRQQVEILEAVRRTNGTVEARGATAGNAQALDPIGGPVDAGSRAAEGDVAPGQRGQVTRGIQQHGAGVGLVLGGPHQPGIELEGTAGRDLEVVETLDRPNRPVEPGDPAAGDDQALGSIGQATERRGSAEEEDVTSRQRGAVGGRIQHHGPGVALILRGPDRASVESDGGGRRDCQVVERIERTNRTVEAGGATADHGQAFDPGQRSANCGARPAEGEIAPREGGGVADGIEANGTAVGLIFRRGDTLPTQHDATGASHHQ